MNVKCKAYLVSGREREKRVCVCVFVFVFLPYGPQSDNRSLPQNKLLQN